MSAEPSPLPALERWQKIALIAGAVGLVVCLVAGLLEGYRTQAFRSYLFAFNLFVGFALGSLAIIMISHLTGGNWGFVLRRPLEASTRTLPVLAVLFLPLLLGIGYVYPWADANVLATNEHIRAKTPYLNPGFFIARAAVYFAVWIGLMVLLNLWSRRQDVSKAPNLSSSAQTLSGPGLVLLVLTVTFAAIDWMMSLEPMWSSTIYGAMVGWGHVLSAYAFCLGAVLLLLEYPPLKGAVAKNTLGDLATLLLAFVMVWAYLSLMQFLLIWSANLPEEVTWYNRRLEGGWGVVGLLLILIHFALPFVILLSHDYRRNPRILLFVVAMLLVMRVVNQFWLIVPAYQPQAGLEQFPAEERGFHVHPLDAAALVGVGGVWLGAFLWQVRRWPLLPLYNPENGLNGAVAGGGNNHHG